MGLFLLFDHGSRCRPYIDVIETEARQQITALARSIAHRASAPTPLNPPQNAQQTPPALTPNPDAGQYPANTR